MNQYLKAIIAVLGTMVSGLSIYYGQEPWYPIVVTGVAAITVYLAPNTPKVPATPKLDANSAYGKILQVGSESTGTGTYEWQKTPDGWEKIHDN